MLCHETFQRPKQFPWTLTPEERRHFRNRSSSAATFTPRKSSRGLVTASLSYADGVSLLLLRFSAFDQNTPRRRGGQPDGHRCKDVTETFAQCPWALRRGERGPRALSHGLRASEVQRLEGMDRVRRGTLQGETKESGCTYTTENLLLLPLEQTDDQCCG